MGKKKFQIIILALIAIIITIGVILYSEQSFNAAIKGLQIWWEVVVPALLPFFILTEILFGLGVVHFIGTMLEPLMQPVFRIPGVGAFAFAMGLASGYPIGAKITGDLRRKNLCSKEEGERLLVLCNTADPLFMIGAVSIGMFKTPEISLILCASHYLSAIIVGLLFRFYGQGKKQSEATGNSSPDSSSDKKGLLNLMRTSLGRLCQARKEDKRTFGQIFGDSVNSSINTILLVGGFIVIFSVLTELVKQINIKIIENFFYYIFLLPLKIPKNFYLPILSGIFEITNGSAMISISEGTLFTRVAIVNAIIAWSGISVLAQTAAMVQGTDIRIKPYIMGRLLHALFAGLITFLWWKPLQTISTLVFKNPFSFLTIWERFFYSFITFILIIIFGLLMKILLSAKKTK